MASLFIRLPATTSLLTIYDDHDFGTNDVVTGESVDSPACSGNRKNCVMYAGFTTPDDLPSDELYVIGEVGGDQRNPVTGLRKGCLVVMAGRKGSDNFTWQQEKPQKAGTRYDLRITAVSQGTGPDDSFKIELLRGGDQKPQELVHQKGRDVDGFAGSDVGGMGVVGGGSVFNPKKVSHPEHSPG